MKLLKKNWWILLFCFVLSFIILALNSKSSFLYPFNDWMDANAFFTVGKGIFKGVVPYRDIFEQKGLILYFLYAFASLISFKSFIGVFIFEVIFFTIALYYLSKIVNLFLDKKYNLVILPIIGTVICVSRAFVHGGSCEEFCFSIFAASLYYYIYHFKVERLSFKQLFGNGILAGILFMTKFNLLGFYFGFMAFIFFDYIFRVKDVKKAILSALSFLAGMFIPILICFVYLYFNHALNDFIDDYFVINITSYGSEKMSIFTKIYKMIRGLIGTIGANGLAVIVLSIALPISMFFIKEKLYFKITLLINIFLCALGIFWGLHFYSYYVLPMFIFLIIPLVVILYLLDKYELVKELSYKFVCLGVFIICGFSAYFCANYRYMILQSKDELFQFKYADYMNKYDNPTMLNMGALDAGLYTVSGIVPNTKFFEVQNIDYERFPDNLDGMKENVINKDVMFILYYGTNDLDYIVDHDSYIFDNYHLVLSEDVYSEYEDRHAYLFQVNE